MSLIVDGVEIPTNGDFVNYNDTSVDKVIYNNVVVWEKILFEDVSFGYTRKIESVEVPPGLYKLEVYGAQGGKSPNGGRGGYGGYSCRYYYFSEPTTLYVVVGGQGGTQSESSTGSATEGYNGGKTWSAYSEYSLNHGTGGGATHIATASGLLAALSGNKNAVLVVAGGGGGGSDCKSTSGVLVCGTGGNGGGLTGEAGVTTSAATSNNCGLSKGTGGTQVVGGASASNVANGTDQGGRGVYTYDGTFGRGGYCSHSCFSGGGGGGGWYGGGQGCHYNGASPGGGGSGYIGENSITHDGVTYRNSCTTSSHTGHGSAKISFVAP